jgi:hypothetical protein
LHSFFELAKSFNDPSKLCNAAPANLLFKALKDAELIREEFVWGDNEMSCEFGELCERL